MLAGLIAGAVPAHALPAPFPTTAMDRCQQGADPDWKTTLRLAGGRGAKAPDPANQVRPGDVVRIVPHAGDRVSATGWWTQPLWVHPDGVSPRVGAPLGWPGPGLNQLSLIGQFDGNRPVEAMRNTNCQQLNKYGTFEFRINDSPDWDNYGSWDVDIAIFRGPVVNGSFDGPASISAPWFTEGTEFKFVSTDSAHTAILSNGGAGWNAILQTIPVRPFTDYVVEGDLRTSANTVFFGARIPNEWPPREQHVGPLVNTTRIRQPFNSGPNTSVTIFAGFWGTNEPHFLSVDNVRVLSR